MSGADVAGGIGVSTAASAKNAIRPGLDGVTRRDRDRVLGCLDGVPGSSEGLDVVQEHEKEEKMLQEKEGGRIKRENGTVGPVIGELWVVLEAKGQEKQQQHQRQQQHQQPQGPQLEHGVSQGERLRKEKQQKYREIISTAGKEKKLKEEREQQRWQQEENDDKLQQQQEELVQQNHQQPLQQQQQQQQPNMTAKSSEKKRDEEQWLEQGQDHREECLDTSAGTKCQALQEGGNDKRSWEKRPKSSDTAIKNCQQEDHHELGRMSEELDVDMLGSDHVRQKEVLEDEGRREHEAASGGPKEVAVFPTEHNVEEPKHKTNQATTGSNINTDTNDNDGKDGDDEQPWREKERTCSKDQGASVRPGAGLKVGSEEQHERGAKEGSAMLHVGNGKGEREHGDEEHGEEDRQEHADGDDKTEGEEDTSVPELVRTRRRNIARNEAMLAALSLPQPKARASLRGKRKNMVEASAAGAQKAAGSAVPAPLRKSKRLRGEKVDSEDLLALPGTWKSCIMGNDRVSGAESEGANFTAGADDSRIKLPVLDVEHASENMKELDKAIRDRDESKAGTASYRHCLHRVQTMGDVRLVRRVRAIERARGKKAAEKMLVFVNVLRDKSKREVLAVAEAALDRLLRGIPMPETS